MTTAQLPLVGVVIPVYNDWAGLQLCLQALTRQTYPQALVRVRVVDNGSHDWPQDPFFPLPVEVIRHAEPGSYGARNQAALRWCMDVLAFTDADCQPDPQWIAAGVKALRLGEEPTRVVAGRIALEAQRPDHPSAGEQLDQILGFDQERTVRRAGFGVTANLFVPGALFERLAGFAARTHSGGDRDFCQRAQAAGARLVFQAESLVRHPARSWRELVLKQRRIVGGRLSLAMASPAARFRVLWLSLRPLISETWRVCRYPGLGVRRRLHLLALVWWIRGAVLLEWVRLQRRDQLAMR